MMISVLDYVNSEVQLFPVDSKYISENYNDDIEAFLIAEKSYNPDTMYWMADVKEVHIELGK